jgi:hypothetical protein
LQVHNRNLLYKLHQPTRQPTAAVLVTINLTHFETICLMANCARQSQRPLLLGLKQLTEDSLQSASEGMGWLTRGANLAILLNDQDPEAASAALRAVTNVRR